MEPRSFPIIPRGHYSMRLSLTHVYEDLASWLLEAAGAQPGRQTTGQLRCREGKETGSQPVPNPALPITSCVLGSRLLSSRGSISLPVKWVLIGPAS